MRALALLIVLAPGVAAADNDLYDSGGGFRFNGELSTEFAVAKRGQHHTDVDDITLVSLNVHSTTGGPHVRYAYAFEGSFGGTFGGGGLAFDVAVLPIGLGLQLRHPANTALLTLCTGIGANGSLTAIDTGAYIPIELTGLFRMDPDTNVQLKLHTAWILNDTTDRATGSQSFSFVDEIGGQIAVQWSDQHNNYLDGTYFGVAYREMVHAHFVGVVLGWGGGEEYFHGSGDPAPPP